MKLRVIIALYTIVVIAESASLIEKDQGGKGGAILLHSVNLQISSHAYTPAPGPSPKMSGQPSQSPLPCLASSRFSK